MRIDSSGNVGIGTSSPSARLQTNSTDGTIAIFRTTSGANNTRLNIDVSDTAATAGFSVGGNSSFPALTFANGGSERMRITSGGDLQFNSGYGSVATAYGCRAWVNFNGTGVVAIRASGNVSSITDNGTGDYTVNFTTSMPDVNYCSLVTGTNHEGQNISGDSKLRDTSANKLAGSVRMQFTINDNQTPFDSPNANLAIFR